MQDSRSHDGAPVNPARHRFLLVAAIILATGAAAFGGPLLLRGPTFIAKVSLVNPSEYDIHVEVSGDEGTSWMSLTTANQRATTDQVDVIDQGPSWVFRFSAQGRDGGELRIARAALKQGGWTVDVPEAVIERLRQQGAPPSP